MENQENKQMKNAINFLLFSYFGITLDDDAKNICNKVVDRAYRDAASHVLSLTDEAKMADNGPKQRAKTEIIDALGKLPSGNPSGYDDFHTKLCERLCARFSEDNGIYKGNDRQFTYGIAQKWVNMTMKYFYVLRPVFSEFAPEGEDCDFCKTYGAQVNALANQLHVPLDGYILKAAKRIDCSDLGSSWSKITDVTKYKEYQDDLRKFTQKDWETPLDWEGPAWIAEARAGSNKE